MSCFFIGSVMPVSLRLSEAFCITPYTIYAGKGLHSSRLRKRCRGTLCIGTIAIALSSSPNSSSSPKSSLRLHLFIAICEWEAEPLCISKGHFRNCIRWSKKVPKCPSTIDLTFTLRIPQCQQSALTAEHNNYWWCW